MCDVHFFSIQDIHQECGFGDSREPCLGGRDDNSSGILGIFFDGGYEVGMMGNYGMTWLRWKLIYPTYHFSPFSLF